MQGFNNLLWWGSIALLLFTVFAFFDAAFRREDAYRAADKQKKSFWLIVLGLAVAVSFLGILFLQIFGLIATIVYMVDVRPAVRQIGGGGRGWRGGRGSSSDGPYGPFRR
jgi:O-antigen/teichoic acid export membrane protein